MTDAKKQPPVFLILLALAVVLPFMGKGGMVASVVIACALLGVPLFALIGLVTILCFALYSGYSEPTQFSPMVERMRGLIDQKTLVAVPLFIMSGSVMARGQISTRLIDFARSCVGWIPGGLGMSAVFACVFFAAISGSSPATVIAIGAMMAPSLIDAGYGDRFSHGLLTSAGSLGILIPPSIPMILYPIVYGPSANIETETLFASGFGPGILIALILMGYCFVYGMMKKTPRDTFELRAIGRTAVKGFWALMFPVLILGGIYGGIYTTVEAAAASVVYAVLVEVYVHRALKLSEVPETFKETGVFLGALLVIMVAALAFDEFLHEEGVPEQLVAWIESLHLPKWQFLLLLNGLLLLVGMAMDILSAMFIFVPLLAPVAAFMGVDPLHFGIIFIVNLEIGYLTPPVGLNLFVASTLFERPLGHIIRSVVPFIGLMLCALIPITYWPQMSVGLGYAIMGKEPPEIREVSTGALQPLDEPDEDDDPEVEEAPDGVMTLQEMMQQAEDGSDDADGDEGVQTLEEMMQEVEESSMDSTSMDSTTMQPASMEMQTLEEMMNEAGI